MPAIATAMMRVRRDLHDRLHNLAESEHASMQDVLDRALDNYERQRLLQQTNRAYAELRADPQAWDAVEAERRVLEGAVGDGIEASDEFVGW